MQNLWLRLDPAYRMTPAELYVKIKDLGYDWDDLLENSVDYWHLNPDIKEHTLTTMHLLRVANGEEQIPWAKNSKIVTLDTRSKSEDNDKKAA